MRGLRGLAGSAAGDRKSTRLNSSHPSISYAVFGLKKKSLDVLLGLGPERAATIHHAENASSLICLGDHDLHGVGGGAVDVAHLADHLDLVEDADGKALAEQDHKAVPRGHLPSCSDRKLD